MTKKRIFLISSLIIIILGCYATFKHYEAKQSIAAEKFNKTHFNPKVSIYDISVGKLTVNDASKKINKHAVNRATLNDNKVEFSKVNQKTITLRQVKSYFNKQKTKYPTNKKFDFKNSDLEVAKNKLTTIINNSVDYKIDGKSYKFNRSEYFLKVSYYDNNYQFYNTEKLSKKIEEINKSVNTFHKEYPFKLPNEKTINVKNESYGWGINSKHLIPAIENAIVKGKKQLDGKNYIYGLGFSTYGTGYGLDNHGFGNTYIVVSISDQKVWFYKNGKNVLVLDDVVTGTAVKHGASQSSDETPVGVWYIQYKESPSTLKGLNDDGSTYASPVRYWMPFTESGCGFHDASWRTDWTKTAYLEGGSHGCVNIKPSQIKSVWDVVEQYEPVIIYK